MRITITLNTEITPAVVILCRIMGANRDDDGGGPRK